MEKGVDSSGRRKNQRCNPRRKIFMVPTRRAIVFSKIKKIIGVGKNVEKSEFMFLVGM